MATAMSIVALRGGAGSVTMYASAHDETSKCGGAAQSPWKVLWMLSLPDLHLVILALVALTLAAVGEAVLPALQGSALNVALGLHTSGEGPREHITRLAVMGVATALFTAVRGTLFWFCGARLVARLRRTLFDALLQQPQAFHDGQSAGELSSRLATDCVKLGDVLSLNLNIVLRQALQSVIGVAFICHINVKLAALVLWGVAVRGILSHFYANASRALSLAQQDALAASSGVAGTSLLLIKVVRAYGTQAAEGQRYDLQLRHLLRSQQRQGLLYGASRVASFDTCL
jgi:ABC-type multidrug transport system fused ATPase/permease subunit